MKDVLRFFHEVKIELAKVIWPKLDEFIGSTIVVLLLVCVFAIYLGVIDQIFSQLARYILEGYGLY